MFSIVITTKNRLAFLRRAVSSILNSSLLPNEIIIVNDGGEKPDFSDIDFGTVSLIIKNNDSSLGANYSRNKGIELSSAENVFLLDDDDAVEEDSFQKRMNVLLKDERIGLVFTGIKIVLSSDLNNVRRTVFPREYSDYTEALFSKGNVIGSTSRVLIRKKFFMAAGKFDETLPCMQDYDLWIRMSQHCKIKHDNSATVIYTVHNNKRQISSNFMKYLETGEVLLSKYSALINESQRKQFMANLYFRVALSSASTSYIHRMRYALLSLTSVFSLKGLILLLTPYTILKRTYLFA
ncbi:glycosyltransferase family 2 protein [Enterobacter ludwigii]|jgi:glycosyltransferase involved in cell wall biosynthesis|uniref:glycosyltransferase family 2 protein n=1 Tax=Enterobacter cloacae complex TaxID=354276 RepID=UPI000839B9E0|nr:glycosyltransferase family A protein [Enterobacter ludwigii]EKS7108273.1 glycosyltransferase family 2 protein [Enterobacter ludwigii]MDF9915490.1 glycosyltransferase family A protein [Enterobacter ludwigii]WFY39021.1 glycosyltransferase family 2 protein [Enterobacter ludwigii]WGC23426.1 glycosyltransferase family 2 protein [Enterobacter ludwigii]HDR2547324.1 glycosyltransferase family 2 protein [Enterobacter ludwigii]